MNVQASILTALIVSSDYMLMDGHARQRVEEPHVPAEAGRNDPCPCGSGKKYKKCHVGRKISGNRKTEGESITARDVRTR